MSKVLCLRGVGDFFWFNNVIASQVSKSVSEGAQALEELNKLRAEIKAIKLDNIQLIEVGALYVETCFNPSIIDFFS